MYASMQRTAAVGGLVAVGIFLFIAEPGCQTAPVNMPAPPTGGPLSFANDVQPIFNAHCISCHAQGTPTNTIVGIHMVLTSGSSFGSLVNQSSSQRSDLTLVTPGNPDASLLWLKVSSNSPPVGSRMPLLNAPLSSSELATIRDWITQGAMNN